MEQSQGRGRTGEVLDVSVGNGGKVTPPRDRGGAERVEMFVNDCKGSGHGPAGEANASDCLVMFNKMGKGPHGRHNVLADALDEPVMHGKEKGGGGGIRGGPGVFGQVLVEDWVPVSEIGVGAKE